MGPLLGEGLVWERGSRPRAPCGEGAAGTSTPSLAASTGTKSSKKQLEILLIFQLLHKKKRFEPVITVSSVLRCAVGGRGAESLPGGGVMKTQISACGLGSPCLLLLPTWGRGLGRGTAKHRSSAEQSGGPERVGTRRGDWEGRGGSSITHISGSPSSAWHRRRVRALRPAASGLSTERKTLPIALSSLTGHRSFFFFIFSLAL